MSEAEAHEDCSLRVRPRHRGTGPRPASVCGELGRSWSASPKSQLFPAAFRWQFAASLGDDTQETGRMKAQGRRRQAATTARVTRGRARLCQHRSPGEGGRDPGSCAGNGDLAFLRGSAATRWLTSPGRGHSGNSTRSGYSRGSRTSGERGAARKGEVARRPASKRGDHRATPAGAVALEAGREGRGESGAPGFLPSVSPRQSRGHRAGDGAEGTWAPARHAGPLTPAAAPAPGARASQSRHHTEPGVPRGPRLPRALNPRSLSSSVTKPPPFRVSFCPGDPGWPRQASFDGCMAPSSRWDPTG